MDGVNAILLAGGRSLRMGREKPLIEVGGETLVARHLRQLREAGAGAALIVCNEGNRGAIDAAAGAPAVLQRGDGMSGAVLTGLDEAAGAGELILVCVNDLIETGDYVALRQTVLPEGIVIATKKLDRVFDGGMLLLDGARVRGIVEKPAGGCPAGSAANIMIHHVRGDSVLSALRDRLRAGLEYEAAVNDLIACGVVAVAKAVTRWTALKVPEDLERALQ